MEQTQIWVLSGLVAMLVGVVGWGLKSAASQLSKKLEAILNELKTLNSKTIIHEQQLQNVHETLKDHEGRIRTLEK